MTGTIYGLRGLIEFRSYTPLGWYDLLERASQRCTLCQHIWDVTEHENWDLEYDGWVVRDEIRVM